MLSCIVLSSFFFPAFLRGGKCDVLYQGDDSIYGIVRTSCFYDSCLTFALPKHFCASSCSCRGDTKKSPAKKVSLPRTNKQLIYPRCHLDSQLTLRRLAGYQHTPGNSRIPTRYRILRKIRFPVPSVVHLTSCFLPDSQHRGFSVKASLPLSPPQRFTIFSC